MPKRSYPIADAIEAVRELRYAYPTLILSGSVALILQGKLPARDVHDLDFSCRYGLIPREINVNEDESGKQPARNHHNGIPFCVFGTYKHVRTEKPRGILVRHYDDIIKYKDSYNRTSDTADRKLYRSDFKAWLFRLVRYPIVIPSAFTPFPEDSR